VDGDTVYCERTGEILPLDKLTSLVCSEAPFILVAHNVAQVIAWLDKKFDPYPRWQFRVTPIQREVWRPNNERCTLVTHDTIVNFFGFQRANGHSENRYHLALDPLLLARKNVHELIPGDAPVPVKLAEWGAQVRAWCLLNGLQLKPTGGGLAAQLLRDRRFYPEDRRKVPKSTNAKARPALPGNYYRLRCDPWISHTATYYDQSASHHSCARALQLPNANSLYAKGKFQTFAGITWNKRGLPPGVRYWAAAGRPLFERAIKQHGLFLLGIRTPAKTRTGFPLPCQETPGFKLAYVWSNELDYLREGGTLIEGIMVAWTSPETDTGLARYAEWSLSQTRENPEALGWLKPTLLAAYGILAANPRPLEFGYKRAKSGEPKAYPVGGQLLKVLAKTTSGLQEASTVNVIHRGMIEAETRLRSIQLARDLTRQGFRVLAIYADSVFVENDHRNVPFPPDGWKIQEELTNLRFFNDVSFTSDQITKLPGIPKDDLLRLSHIKSFGVKRKPRTTPRIPLAERDRRAGLHQKGRKMEGHSAVPSGPPDRVVTVNQPEGE
jgi:hypothetical protein